MGRPERVLDRGTGPVADFAGQLRELRDSAGRPTYRELAARTHYSPTVLSRAAAGRELPSAEVTRAFATACGADPAEWERRLARARAADRAPTPPPGPAPLPATATAAAADAPAAASGRAPGSVRSRAVAAAVVLLAVLAGSGAESAGSVLPAAPARPGLDPSWSALTQHVSAPVEVARQPEPMDGDDPRARDCVADATVRQEVPLYLADGTRFGTLRLRHSNRCGTSWASAYYQNPLLYRVWVAAHRTADGAEVQSDWSNNTPPGSYGDMLSTAAGCVWVEATVTTPAGTGPAARTSCLR